MPHFLCPSRRPTPAHTRRSMIRFRPAADVLEGRAMLSTLHTYHATDGPSLASAVQTANGQTGGSQIILDNAGTYNLSSALNISSDIKISGRRGFRPDLYVIQPATGVTDRVIDVTGAHNVTIRGVTIQDGSTSGDGGGIDEATSGAQLTLQNVVIRNNTAGGDGGGVSLADGAGLTITASTLRNNTAGGDGGGVAFLARSQSASVIVDSSAFLGNKASGTSSRGMGDGGGILVQAMTPSGAPSSAQPPSINATVTFTSFLNNTSAHDGGGMWNSDVSSLRFNNVYAVRNTSVQDAGGIGDSDMNLNGASFTFTNSYVASNSVTGPGTATTPDGGGICFDFHPTVGSTPTGQVAATITGNVLLNNSVAGGGGGLFLRDDGSQTIFTANVSRNSFASNTATLSTIAGEDNGSGAGLYVDASAHSNSLTIGRNFVAFNTAAVKGGGLALELDSGTADVSFNTFLRNQANNGGGVSVAGNTTSGAQGGTVNLANDTLIANSATPNGGGVSVDQTGVANLSGDLIILNDAGTAGGGVLNSGGTVAVKRSTITRNTAPSGPNVSGSYTDQGGNHIG